MRIITILIATLALQACGKPPETAVNAPGLIGEWQTTGSPTISLYPVHISIADVEWTETSNVSGSPGCIQTDLYHYSLYDESGVSYFDLTHQSEDYTASAGPCPAGAHHYGRLSSKDKIHWNYTVSQTSLQTCSVCNYARQ